MIESISKDICRDDDKFYIRKSCYIEVKNAKFYVKFSIITTVKNYHFLVFY